MSGITQIPNAHSFKWEHKGLLNYNLTTCLSKGINKIEATGYKNSKLFGHNKRLVLQNMTYEMK